jgi:hypothetical protein
VSILVSTFQSASAAPAFFAAFSIFVLQVLQFPDTGMVSVFKSWAKEEEDIETNKLINENIVSAFMLINLKIEK